MVDNQLINPDFIIVPEYRDGSPKWEIFYQRIIWDSTIPVPKTFFILDFESLGKQFYYRRCPPFILTYDQCSSWLKWTNIKILDTIDGIQMLTVLPGKNPIDKENKTGICSRLDYRLYSIQVSNQVMVPLNKTSDSATSVNKTNKKSKVRGGGCQWCCGFQSS